MGENLRPLRTSSIAVLIACQLTAGLSSSARAHEEEHPSPPPMGTEGFLWDEFQMNNRAWIAGVADFDGQPGDELLIDAAEGGFYVTGKDGSVQWRYDNRWHMGPNIVPDIDGDGLPEVLAQPILNHQANVLPDDEQRAVLLSGATGDVLWDKTTPDIEGYGNPVAGDLNADGAVDLVLPGFKDFPDPHYETVIQVFFGPDFSTGWAEAVPGAGVYKGPSLQRHRPKSIVIGNLDEDPGAEVVVGSYEPGTSAGFLTVLEGESGAERWSVQTNGEVQAVAVSEGSVFAYTRNEVVEAVSSYGSLAAYSASDGALSWSHIFTGEDVGSGLVVGDLDGLDGTDEIVFANARRRASPPGGGEPTLYAFSVDGIPRWRRPLQRVASSLTLVPRPGGGSDVGYGTSQSWSHPSAMPPGSRIEEVGLVSGLTGAPIWTLAHEPEAGWDSIYGVASADVDGDGNREFVYITNDQHLFGLDPVDGSVRFERSYPGFWTAADAADINGDGAIDIVGGGTDGLVRARDGASDRDLWSRPIGGSIARLEVQGSSILGIHLGLHAGVFSLDSRSGEIRWALELGLARHRDESSLLHTGVGDLNGDGTEDAVVTIQRGDITSVRPMDLTIGEKATPYTIVAVDGASGELLWEREMPVDEGVHLSIVDGDVVVERYNGRDGNVVVASWDGTTGTERWEVAAEGSSVPPLAESAVGLGDLILVPFADGPLLERTGTVNAYRASDGTLAWTKTFDGEHQLVAASNRVMAVPYGHSGQPLRIFDQSGQERQVPPGPLEQWGAGWAVAPGAGFVHVDHHGVGPGGGIELLDLDALLGGRVEVVRKFHLPKERADRWGQPFRIASTPSGPVMVGLNSFFYGSGSSSGAAARKQTWALLLPQTSG